MLQTLPGNGTAGRIRLVAVALCTCVVCGGTGVARAVPALDEVMADFAFTPDDVQRVRQGELVKTTTKETSEREIAAVMVFLVKAPPSTLVSSFEVGRGFTNDPQVQAATQITGGGTLDDFKSVVLQPGGAEETQRYLRAAPGDTLNLSADEIARFQALAGGGQAQVEAALREVLLARYQAYRAKGLAGIAPYARGPKKYADPAGELRRATEAATGLKKHVPAFYDALLNYPSDAPAELRQHFFCIRYTMSDRPNFTLRHRLAMPIGDAFVLADREFYVSHDYNQTQAIAALLPVEDGTVVAYLNRTTTDQLGGFGASAKQAIGRSMMAKQISAIFEKSRANFTGK